MFFAFSSTLCDISFGSSGLFPFAFTRSMSIFCTTRVWLYPVFLFLSSLYVVFFINIFAELFMSILFLFLLDSTLCLKNASSTYIPLMICIKNGNISCFPLWKMDLSNAFTSPYLACNSFLTFVVRFCDFQHRELVLNHCVLLGPSAFICKIFLYL